MGSVYRRRNTRYLWIKYQQNGRTVRESAGAMNLTVTRRKLRVREGEVERGLPVGPKVGGITFEEAATDVLNDYRMNGRRTYADAERRINKHLKPFFGNRRMASITTSDVRAYVVMRQSAGQPVRSRRSKRAQDASGQSPPGRRRPVSAGEINRELTALKRWCELGCLNPSP